MENIIKDDYKCCKWMCDKKALYELKEESNIMHCYCWFRFCKEHLLEHNQFKDYIDELFKNEIEKYKISNCKKCKHSFNWHNDDIYKKDDDYYCYDCAYQIWFKNKKEDELLNNYLKYSKWTRKLNNEN